jgi:AraC family transcriptional regulator
VLERIDCDPPPNAETLGRELELHPAWLSQSYRSVIGEGLQQTLMRKRVERASLLLRNSDQPAAQIAVETGFCDQSHMIRRFRKLLGRTPYQVRTEGGANLAALPPVPAVESANSPC